MKFSTSLLILATSVTLCSAAPTAAPAADASSVQKFLLVAKTVPAGGMYDGYYVAPVHTQAGFNYAALVKDPHKKHLIQAYLNNTRLIFDFGKNLNPVEQYPMEFLNSEFSTSWGATNINAVYGKDGKNTFPVRADGFRIDSRNRLLQAYDRGKTFKKLGIPDWRICLWNHGTPELFFNIPFNYDDGHVKLLPPNCNFADLVVEYV